MPPLTTTFDVYDPRCPFDSSPVHFDQQLGMARCEHGHRWLDTHDDSDQWHQVR